MWCVGRLQSFIAIITQMSITNSSSSIQCESIPDLMQAVKTTLLSASSSASASASATASATASAPAFATASAPASATASATASSTGIETQVIGATTQKIVNEIRMLKSGCYFDHTCQGQALNRSDSLLFNSTSSSSPTSSACCSSIDCVVCSADDYVILRSPARMEIPCHCVGEFVIGEATTMNITITTPSTQKCCFYVSPLQQNDLPQNGLQLPQPQPATTSAVVCDISEHYGYSQKNDEDVSQHHFLGTVRHVLMKSPAFLASNPTVNLLNAPIIHPFIRGHGLVCCFNVCCFIA